MLESSSDSDVSEQIAQLQLQLQQNEALLAERAAQLEARDRHIRLLEDALRLMRVEKYGASREKLGEAPGQRGLFNEAEAAVEVLEAVGFDAPLEATPLREDKAPAKSSGETARPLDGLAR